MAKVFETMDPNSVMGYYSAIGNPIVFAKELKELGQDGLSDQALQIAAFYLDYLTSEVVPPPVGIQAVFNPGERPSFVTIKGRLGYDSKTVTKMIREAIKDGKIGVEGVRRARRYFVL